MWSRRRIASQLGRLGHEVDKDTVARYMAKPTRRPARPPSTTWKAFVRAHLPGTIAIDFLVVPTATLRLLYVFFVLSLKRRRLLHVNVTAHPHQTWTAQQVVEAVGFDTDIAHLIRDRDGIYGRGFNSRVNHLGIQQIKTAPRSPWQNGYAERFAGTLRRELLDHVIVLGNNICCDWFGPMPRTTTRTALTWRSTGTRLFRRPSSHPNWAASSPSHASPAFTTATLERPEPNAMDFSPPQAPSDVSLLPTREHAVRGPAFFVRRKVLRDLGADLGWGTISRGVRSC